MTEQLVIIPYLAVQAQGRELEFAVAGWRRHFKVPHHIVVVGDHHPVCDTGADISFVPCPRIPEVAPGLCRKHLDHVHKFRTVRRFIPPTKGFIYACDDMYAVNDFGMEEILFPKVHYKVPHLDRTSSNSWQKDLAKTYDLCVREGFRVWDWVCHLPVYYDWDKLFAVYDEYGCDRESYVVENIYFNKYFGNRCPLVLDLNRDNLKTGVYRSNPDERVIRKSLENKIWLTNGPEGWVPALEKVLSEHYR